jgi:thiamine-phosphate pyrophosphorylase
LESAKRHAYSQSAERVEPRHLLQGLLQEPEGRAAVLLVQAGVGQEQIQSICGLSLAATEDEADSMELSDRSAAVFQCAGETAAELTAERTVAGEHLLLALLRQDELLRQELAVKGLDYAGLEGEICGSHMALLKVEEPLHLVEASEKLETARVLDASANRAREALRVIEDYCRFVLDDRFLTNEWKQLRHGLVQALSVLPGSLFAQARDTERDVGTDLSNEQERHRAGTAAVVRANLKRLQESLRSIEEFGKVLSPDLGVSVEGLRYRSYTLEKAVLLGKAGLDRLASTRLCVLVTGRNCTASLDWTIQEVIAGGAGMIQLREKDLDDRELLARARKVRRLTGEVLFIVNDRPDIAKLAEADGVHLGQEDMSPRDARRIVGPDAIIGLSTHTVEQARQAVLEGATYIGVGPVFASGTKAFSVLPGLELVQKVTAELSVPAFAIGGINFDNISAVVAAGGRRAAVSQAVCQADDPRAAASQLVRRLQSTESQ